MPTTACTVFDQPSGKWILIDCSMTQVYTCYAPCLPVPQPTTQTPPTVNSPIGSCWGCPAAYASYTMTSYKDQCYFTSIEDPTPFMIWSDAYWYCVNNNAQLAMPKGNDVLTAVSGENGHCERLGTHMQTG
jgi:hypothetical protein